MPPLLIVPAVGQFPALQAVLILVLPVMPARSPDVLLMPRLDRVKTRAISSPDVQAILPVPGTAVAAVLATIVLELLVILMALSVGLQTRRVSPLEANMVPLLIHRAHFPGVPQALLPPYMTDRLRLRQSRPPMAKRP